VWKKIGGIAFLSFSFPILWRNTFENRKYFSEDAFPANFHFPTVKIQNGGWIWGG
jgi:hypothetical protein